MSQAKSNYSAFLQLNLALLMISTSGVLGRTVTISPELAIFWRSLLATLILGLFIYFKRIAYKIYSRSDLGLIILGGTLMCIHWVTYFYALSLANVAVAIVSLHTFPVITAILEPLILKTKFKAYHLFLTGLVLIGIYMLTPNTDLSDNKMLAIIFGLFSALTYSLRNIFTRKVISNYHGTSMMFFQLIVITCLLIPYLFIHSSAPLTNDWAQIIGLAILTTAIGHTLLVHSLKNFSAITVALLSCIIPIYAILWPYLFLGEVPESGTLIGGGFIILSFVVEAYISNKNKEIT